jgi:transposase-like protein
MPNQRAETVAKAFVNEVVTRHGVPSKLLTDKGRNFEADLMKQVFSLLSRCEKTKNFAVPSPNGRTSGENESHVEGNSDSLCK